VRFYAFFQRNHFFGEFFKFYGAVAARGYTWKGTGRERSQAHERRAGRFVRLLHSREVSSSSHATTARASMRLLLLRSVAVVKSLLLPRVADVSCRISGKFSAFFCVHFWLIIRLSFVVFCFSIHRMRSSSSLWFYAMLALRLVVLFWQLSVHLCFLRMLALRFFLFRDCNGKEPYQLVSRSGETVHCISALGLCCNREARASLSILHIFSWIRPGFVAVLQSFSMVEVLCTKPAGKKIPVDLTVARR
jgi:hypothetical protein